MPGIRFAQDQNGMGNPLIERYMGQGGSGGGGTIYQGDLVVLTTKSTLTTNATPVVRTLLAADKTAHYLQGGVAAGILGMGLSDMVTNSSGVANASINPGGVSAGGVIYPLPSDSAGWGLDTNTGRSFYGVALASGENLFYGYLDSSSANATPALDSTLAGFILTGTAPTTFTVDTNAATADQCIIIVRCVETDPNYGKASGLVVFRFVGSFNQYATGINYSSN